MHHKMGQDAARIQPTHGATRQDAAASSNTTLPALSRR